MVVQSLAAHHKGDKCQNFVSDLTVRLLNSMV